jgi:hypothetical protein
MRWRIAFSRVCSYALPAAVLLILGQMTRLALKAHALAFDAANSYVPAARDLLHGKSPYHLAEIAHGVAFASPPVAAFLFAPFTVLPTTLADLAMAALMLAAVLAALSVLGVRDWRCYAIASVSAPLVDEFQTANLSALLALCAALLWRYRDRTLVAAAAAGVPVALKLLGWPMILFLLLTRRFRAAAWSMVIGAAGIVLPWAAVGFTGIRGYPHLLGVLERAEREQAYSVRALVSGFASWRAADAVTYLLTGALIIAAWRARSDARTFIACLGATLVVSPVVWMHYFVLVYVAIAVARPDFGAIWAVPLVLWVSAREGPAHPWENAVVLGVVTAAFVAAFMRPPTERCAGDVPTPTLGAAWSG